MSIKTSSRITIMDGQVITLAMGFQGRKGLFGIEMDPIGPFEISASRNMVVVHRAAVAGQEQAEQFKEAFDNAVVYHNQLARGEKVQL